MSIEDLVDIVHNIFRYSGFVLKSHFRKVDRTPSCGAAYGSGSWIDAPISLEQLRVERHLRGAQLENKNLLHVGIGSSAIARKFHRTCKHIDGITVMEEELKHAQGLEISNYNVYLMNKYTDKIAALPNKYHYIVDTNLASYTPSRSDLAAMVERYIALLESGGMILTDRLGMHFHESYAFPIYDEDLIAFERVLPVKFEKVNRSVRALVKIQA